MNTLTSTWRRSGTRALTGPLSMGGFRLTGLANATTNGDAVPFQQAVKSGDAASGDLAGTFPNPGVGKLAGVPLASTAPASGQVLTFNGTSWAPAAPAAAALPNIGCSQCSATGSAATALGLSTQATGFSSLAAGEGPQASGEAAAAFGIGTKASGASSLAAGFFTAASGEASFASGSAVIAGGEDSVALGHGVVAADGTFMFGDHTAVVGWDGNPNEFDVRASGGIRLRTAADLSTGCDLPAGSGVFSCTSSRYLTTDFLPVDDDALLAGIAAVPVTTWRYKTEAHPVRHLGPMAQAARRAR